MNITFYTAGCPRSQITGKNLKKALQQLGMDSDMEIIDDPRLHQEHGVSAFPAIKIDGKILSEGDFCSVDDCKELLAPFASK